MSKYDERFDEGRQPHHLFICENFDGCIHQGNYDWCMGTVYLDHAGFDISHREIDGTPCAQFECDYYYEYHGDYEVSLVPYEE